MRQFGINERLRTSERLSGRRRSWLARCLSRPVHSAKKPGHDQEEHKNGNKAVAAWRVREDILVVRSSTSPTATRQVISVQINAATASAAMGLRSPPPALTIPAVTAARTRIHSSPSRNTITPISRAAAIDSPGLAKDCNCRMPSLPNQNQ
jgi:hypothetical protein